MCAETIKRIKTGLLTMNASLIKFAVAVLASVIITGCGGGSSANNSAQQDSPVLSDELPVAITYEKINFSAITDENLANCIKENEITHTGVQVLVCADKDIQSLDGIEQLSNLRVVDLNQNKIRNIQPLAKLGRLVSLDISSNDLKSLNGLDELSELYWLNVSNNQLADAELLQNLKKLKSLYIRNNALQSLTFVSSLESLENLDAENNQRSSLPKLPSGIKTFNI